jgi:hypothetical protein
MTIIFVCDLCHIFNIKNNEDVYNEHFTICNLCWKNKYFSSDKKIITKHDITKDYTSIKEIEKNKNTTNDSNNDISKSTNLSIPCPLPMPDVPPQKYKLCNVL